MRSNILEKEYREDTSNVVNTVETVKDVEEDMSQSHSNISITHESGRKLNRLYVYNIYNTEGWVREFIRGPPTGNKDAETIKKEERC